MRVVREDVFIFLNKNIWRKFRQAVPTLRKDGECVKLTSHKRVFTREFEGSLYVTFEGKWAKEGEEFTTWINLSMDEMDVLVKHLWEIDQLIPCFKISECTLCHDSQLAVKMVDGKMRKTLLDPKAFKTAQRKKNGVRLLREDDDHFFGLSLSQIRLSKVLCRKFLPLLWKNQIQRNVRQ